MKSLLHALFFFLLVTQICFTQQNFWQLQGSPYGKQIRSIVTGENGNVFLSVDDGSLFRSTNDGELWILNEYNHSVIQCMAVYQNQFVYAGTSEDGIFRSGDAGNTWQQISTGLNNLNILSIASSPDGTVYCGSDGGGVYRITANDTNCVYLGLANVPIISLIVSNNGWLYAGTAGYSIYRSTNGGNEWTLIDSGIGDNRNIFSFAIDSSETIYAGTELGVYRSSNGGDVWFQSNNGLPDTVVYSLAVSPSQAVIASAGDIMFVSTNSGNSWAPHDVFGAVPECFAVSESGFLYTGTILGLYRSQDNIASWTRMNNGLSNGQTIQSICFNTSGDLFTALSSGMYQSGDNGVSWYCTSLHNENIKELLSTRENGFIFAGTEYGITRSTDGGLTWSEKTGFWNAHKVSIDVDASGILYAGYSAQGWWSYNGAFLRSTDLGENWETASLEGISVNALNVRSSGEIMVARADSGIFVSTDQGITWEAKGLNIQNISSALYSSSGCMFAGTDNGLLYRSCDNGINWQDISIPDFTAISCMIFNSSGHIFLADSNGVFRSTDNGDNWTTLNGGLTETYIHTLKIDNAGFLWAGSASGYVFKSNQIISDFSESTTMLPESFYLHQNFPNPFNPSTSIRFSVPQTTYVQLKVFDLLGCEVMTLVSEELAAGNYDVNFSATGISTGVYIYQFKAGTYMASKKMLLIR